jgi:hypothetical protein
MLLVITGIFFQNQQFLDVGIGPDGSFSFINAGMFMTTFSGICKINPDGSIQDGYMNDLYGYSDLTEVRRGSGAFSYTKKYAKKDDLIHYEFALDPISQTWIGTYRGDIVGRGISRVALCETDDAFFDLISAHRFLGEKSPFMDERR